MTDDTKGQMTEDQRPMSHTALGVLGLKSGPSALVPWSRLQFPMPKRLYIDTVGCQMNVLDSELVAASLLRGRLRAGRQPAPGRHDPVQHVQRPPARRGQDLQRPGPAEARQASTARRRSSASWAAWPRRTSEQIFQPGPARGPGGRAGPAWASCRELLERVAAGRRAADRGEPRPQRPAPRPAVQCELRPLRSARASRRGPPARHQAMVRIMFGCDKFCTYCIVPSVRGPEQSRPAAEIESEVRQLADQGCLEVTLLGPDGQQLPRPRRRADASAWPICSERLHEIDGIRRLRFVTNHPRHMTDDLLQAVRDLPKVCPICTCPPRAARTQSCGG